MCLLDVRGSVTANRVQISVKEVCAPSIVTSFGKSMNLSLLMHQVKDYSLLPDFQVIVK